MELLISIRNVEAQYELHEAKRKMSIELKLKFAQIAWNEPKWKLKREIRTFRRVKDEYF